MNGKDFVTGLEQFLGLISLALIIGYILANITYVFFTTNDVILYTIMIAPPILTYLILLIVAHFTVE